MKLSSFEIKALMIIRELVEVNARIFAKRMWGDSPAWNKLYNTGNGATRGKGMWLCAGGKLSRLHDRGLLVYGVDGLRHRLSGEGRRLLEEQEKESKDG